MNDILAHQQPHPSSSIAFHRRVDMANQEVQTEQRTPAYKKDPLEVTIRLLFVSAGAAVLVCGTVLAFAGRDGVATAAMMASGVALAFIAYLGRYLKTIKFREFELTLERIGDRLERVGTKAVETVTHLENLAASYESVRAAMSPGGERDDEMSKMLAQAEDAARQGRIGLATIAALSEKGGKGNRIEMLGYMKGDPRLRDFDLVLQAIDNPHSGFDQDRFLLLAGEMLPDLDQGQRQRLRDVIVHQRSSGEIRPNRIRWLTAERILRLMDR
jgi:hypothetical protein